MDRRTFLKAMALGAAAFAMPPVLSAALPTTKPWQPAHLGFVFEPDKQYGNYVVLWDPYDEEIENILREIIKADMKDYVPPAYRSLVRIWSDLPLNGWSDPLDQRWGVCWKYKPKNVDPFKDIIIVGG